MRFVDANIFLRYLVADDSPKADVCFAFFQRLKTGEEAATTSEAIVAEVACVLRSRAHYGLMPSEIGERLRPLLSLRGLKLTHKRTYLRALAIWATYPALDFEDALIVAHMERLALRQVVSYDSDFDRIPSVERTEP